MTHDKYYLISPTDTLISLIEGSNPDVRSYLSSPLLWTGQFPDRGTLTPDDEVVLVQTLFLMGVLEMISVADFIQSAGGEPIQFSAEFFNKHWEISELYEDNSVKQAIRDAAKSVRFSEFLSSANERIASYIHGVIQN